jgi:hypothetical protein
MDRFAAKRIVGARRSQQRASEMRKERRHRELVSSINHRNRR